MYWNNRVFKTKVNEYGSEVDIYTIHEVYYNEDNTIMGWVDKEEGPYGESLEELKRSLEWMLEACDKPVIDRAELEEEMKNRPPEPEEEYESYNSMEEFLAALDEDYGGPVERP